jgi:hypothetical protein
MSVVLYKRMGLDYHQMDMQNTSRYMLLSRVMNILDTMIGHPDTTPHKHERLQTPKSWLFSESSSTPINIEMLTLLETARACVDELHITIDAAQFPNIDAYVKAQVTKIQSIETHLSVFAELPDEIHYDFNSLITTATGDACWESTQRKDLWLLQTVFFFNIAKQCNEAFQSMYNVSFNNIKFIAKNENETLIKFIVIRVAVNSLDQSTLKKMIEDMPKSDFITDTMSMMNVYYKTSRSAPIFKCNQIYNYLENLANHMCMEFILDDDEIDENLRKILHVALECMIKHNNRHYTTGTVENAISTIKTALLNQASTSLHLLWDNATNKDTHKIPKTPAFRALNNLIDIQTGEITNKDLDNYTDIEHAVNQFMNQYNANTRSHIEHWVVKSVIMFKIMQPFADRIKHTTYWQERILYATRKEYTSIFNIITTFINKKTHQTVTEDDITSLKSSVMDASAFFNSRLTQLNRLASPNEMFSDKPKGKTKGKRPTQELVDIIRITADYIFLDRYPDSRNIHNITQHIIIILVLYDILKYSAGYPEYKTVQDGGGSHQETTGYFTGGESWQYYNTKVYVADINRLLSTL